MLDKVIFCIPGAGRESPLPIRMENVAVSLGPTPILKRIDLELASCGPTVLIGPNGSGKTTLLKLVMGVIPPCRGRITFAGRNEPPARSRAMVFQAPVMLRRKAAANIAFALSACGRSSDPAAVARLLDLAGLAHVADRPARKLSGGEQRRLALVRALAREPSLLLLDEPTESLDPAATQRIEALIARIAEAGIKVLMSTHDLGQARRLAADVVFMAHGQVVEHADARDFFSGPATALARTFIGGGLILQEETQIELH